MRNPPFVPRMYLFHKLNGFILIDFLFLFTGDRNSSTIHDHVILPKQLTDEFYSTWTQCYEELFHASLSPKYVPRKDSTTSLSSKVNKRNKYGELHHSVSELNLAAQFTNDGYTSSLASTRSRNNKRMNRLSLDVSHMSLDFNDDHFYRRHQRHLSDSDSTMRNVKCMPTPVVDKTNFSKLFGAINGRKKAYKLPDTPP